ncbi:MAG: peptide chain release factor 1 [Clostridia bacterium]|nr:peptide chain release factor 1 [Bacillota bacterium]MBO2521902.1 peptide chain release factor 1 [Bacillota bacterium]
MSTVLEKLDAMEVRYEKLAEELARPEVINNPQEFQRLAKAHADLAAIVETYREYKRVVQDLAAAKELIKESQDPELRALAEEERESLELRKDALEREIRKLLIPKDPNDEKNVIVEIRAGAGGEEAALFAGDLFRMYNRYAERQGWKTELLSAHPTELGGFKEVIFMVHGQGAYSQLKFESGVHRVQRVPATEAGGRIHTSTATVAVLPEAEEVEVEIDPADLRIDVYRSSGPGGQSVNTTDSAVRITHLPTGLVVSCQDEKSQHKNKEKALRILRARLLDKMQREQAEALAAQRKVQVGTGDRSERIRTYNFPQGRVTDHRIGMTWHQLNQVLDGELHPVIEALAEHERAEKLREMEA